MDLKLNELDWNEKNMIKITHLAHAGFLIENDKEKLIIDPADNSFGYEYKNETVNYLLVSHEHFDHNNIENIKVEDNIGSFKINKIDSFHDKENGNMRGTNIIHVIETKNTRICHLGDLGHILTDEQISLIGQIDVLLVPVGGFYTIDYQEAIEVVNQLKPNAVIPMHYKTDNWETDKPIDLLDSFLENIQDYKIIELDNKTLDYKKTDEQIVYVLN